MSTENNEKIMESFDKPFQSLDEMRDAHRFLRMFSRSTQNEREPMLEKIGQLLRAGVQLGEQLDLAADRDHAQGILDYWASMRETEYRDPSETQRLSSVQDAVLVPFNREAAQALVAGGERVLENLSEKDRELACRILVRMIHLDPKSRVFTVGKEPLTALRKMAEPAKVDSLIQSLEGVNILRRTREADGDYLTLSHESLMRRWTPLSEALAQRLRFREAAEFWEAHDRDAAALLSAGPLLEEAVAYRDMGDLEREFADASREKKDRSRSQLLRLLLALAFVLIVGVLLLAASSLLAYLKNEQLTDQTKLATDSNLKLKEVNNALVIRQNLSIVVQIARAIAEIEASDQSVERELSRRRLNLLVSEYPEISRDATESFSDTLSGLLNGTESSDDRTRLLTKILNYGRTLKAEVLKGTKIDTEEKNLLDVARKERVFAFELVRYCSQQIVSKFEQNQPVRDADQFVVEFWKLYWADVAFVEQQGVERAMVNFGKKLNEIDTRRLEKIPHRFKSIHVPENVGEHLNDRQFAQNLIASLPPEEIKSTIDELRTQTLSESDVKELRTLADLLSEALDLEQKQPVISEYPLAEY